jgi:Rod binding domain-containing protein
MSDALALPTQPVGLLTPAATLGPVAKGASSAKMSDVAHQFEASFVASMLEPMFDSLSTAPPFGGGEGEAAYKSFFVDAVAKEVAKKSGLHLSDAIQREMLKMQGAR